jgi:hypothetical protein
MVIELRRELCTFFKTISFKIIQGPPAFRVKG